MRVGLTGLYVLLLAAGFALAEDSEEDAIVVGKDAPEFRLNDQHGKALGLATYGKDAWTIVAFFPKSATPG